MRTVDRLLGSVHGAATRAPVFGLTFDDGPDEENTSATLEVLTERRAQATFFVLVPKAREVRTILADILARGHEIGLHGGTHVDLSRSSPRKVVSDIRGARAQLEQLIGNEVRLFRPPYGTQNLFSFAIARTCGLEVVAWTASPRDFLALDSEQQASIALSELEPGGILLLHDGHPPTPKRRREILERVLAGAEDRALTPTTVTELLRYGDPIRRVWLRSRAEGLIDEMSPFLLRSSDGV